MNDETEPKKRKRPPRLNEGRPTKYDPKYCEMLVEHRRAGYSYESFGAVIGTTRVTLYNWEKEYPEFLYAKKRAKEASLKTLESLGLSLASGKIKGNPAAWIFIMKNHHSDLYRENPDMSLENIDGLVFENE